MWKNKNSVDIVKPYRTLVEKLIGFFKVTSTKLIDVSEVSVK